jgi:cytosine/adenosine deaminase-related metal-dependent hydrolase
MEGRLLIKNCTVPEGELLRGRSAVVVEGSTVTRVTADETEPVRPGDWAVDGRGRLLLPGRIDGHAWLVPPEGQGRKRTAAEVEALAAAGMAEALRGGITTIFDQLSAVADPPAALAVEARTARQLGIRLVTGLAADGMHAVAEHDVNVEFSREHRNHPLVRGALGFATCLGASDELLTAVARAAGSLGVPVQFRLAESDSELAEHFEQYRMRMVERLDRHGLLAPSAVAAHARSVDGAEARLLAQRGVVVAWSPLADLLGDLHGFDAVWTTDHRVALASSGVATWAEQWTAARILAHRASRVGRLWPAEELPQVLLGGPEGLLKQIFGVPGAAVGAGALADLVLLDLVPSEGDTLHEVLSQAAVAPAAWTVVHGRVVVREGQLLGSDLPALLGEAARVRGARA